MTIAPAERPLDILLDIFFVDGYAMDVMNIRRAFNKRDFANSLLVAIR